MNWPVILSISKTHLLSRKRQSIIASLGVMFGIGTFIILMGFMTGLNQLLDGLILDRTPHVHIYNEIMPSEKQPIQLFQGSTVGINNINSVKPRKAQDRIHNAVPLLQHFRNDARVHGVSPQLTAQVFYLSGSIQLNGILNGVDILEEVRLFSLDDYIIDGNAMDLARHDSGIILGAGIASKMTLKVGDKIQIATVAGDLFQLKIVGLYQSGLADIDNVQSYVNLKNAQRIMGVAGNYITDLNIKLIDIENAVKMASEIRQQFNLSAIDINAANAQFETGTTVRNIITMAVSITLLVVAGFGIYNILNMMIYEKMNDIAILKATGFSGMDVKLIFISQAMLIGVVGGIMGLIFGFGISVMIDHTPFETEALPTIKTYPINFNPAYYVTAIVFAVISTFLAGYLPAKKAQQIDPVEIIRGQ